MRVELRTRGFGATRALRDCVERRLEFALGRFAFDIDAVVVRLTDVNGPRGGPDKRCQLLITGPRIGRLAFQETGEDVYASVAVLADRGARGLRRVRERRREVDGAEPGGAG